MVSQSWLKYVKGTINKLGNVHITVTLWHICVTTVAMETQHIPFLVNLNVAVNNINMLCAATEMQQ